MPSEKAASLESVRQKLYRVRHHYDELLAELRAYYLSEPGVHVLEQTPHGTLKITFKENQPLPARFGLIFGDGLQCLRTALDYLVWELVLANGHEPGKHNMFPIAITSGGFENLLRCQRRLEGVHPDAVALIQSVQPFASEAPMQHPFWWLDDLAITNRHKRVLLTQITATFGDPPCDFPHLRSKIGAFQPDGERTGELHAWTCVRIAEGALASREVSTVLDVLFQTVAGPFLSSFEPFFQLESTRQPLVESH